MADVQLVKEGIGEESVREGMESLTSQIQSFPVLSFYLPIAVA